MVAYYSVKQRSRAFYYMFAAAAIDAISAIAKLNAAEARPFWVSDEVQAFHCSGQFGNPSGHCFQCMGVPLVLWLDYNQQARRNPNMKLGGWYWRALIFVIMLIFTATIAYSRMFLGVHSLNQVFYGLSLGIWFAVTAHFLIKERLMGLVQNLIDEKETKLGHLFWLSLLLFVGSFSIQIVNYARTMIFEIPTAWKI